MSEQNGTPAARRFRRSVGIIGSGVAALHLGLFLRQHGVSTTIYTDKHPDSIAKGRLLNTVVHHAPTLAREHELEIDFWLTAEIGIQEMSYHVGGPNPISFVGSFLPPSAAIDYRIYLPRLMQAFEERGGEIRMQILRIADIQLIADNHDLVVVASGRSTLGEAFPRRMDKSPYARPPRALCVGLFRGVRAEEPATVTINLEPGQGELIEIPLLSFDGLEQALLFEICPGSALIDLANVSPSSSPDLFRDVVLGALREHFPGTYERVDLSSFGLIRPLDLLQGVLTPLVREDWVRLPSGKIAVSLGDVHAAIDPMMGQGANVASHTALDLGRAILDESEYDELFAETVATARRPFVEAASDWTNMMLRRELPGHLLELLGVMPGNRALADVFTSNFGSPDRQWRAIATEDRARAFTATWADHAMSGAS
jgi:2-polyprenyl-6-methoxyphenol hydroxylase-like FAD-dependent oxidoreductase